MSLTKKSAIPTIDSFNNLDATGDIGDKEKLTSTSTLNKDDNIIGDIGDNQNIKTEDTGSYDIV